MKIQSLAIIFIILILPISILLSSYTQNRVQTINLQSTYDSKLNDATYDALKAYQLNSYTSGTGDYTNSKIRDIKASVNTFFNSMSNSFSSLGYTKETLQNYIPAIVYTMYDGYYIYSPYENTWSVDSNNSNIREEMQEQITTQNTYKNGEILSGLKPYVYYSCRYKGSPNQTNQEDSQFDIVITYSLDNYIQIQGYIKENGQKKTISKYGYLLSNIITPNVENNLRETISYIDYNGNAKTQELPCIKKNGTKYYNDGDKIFSVLNGKAIDQSTAISADEILNNTNAQKYYEEAKNLISFIENNSFLRDLTTDKIVKEGNNDLEYFEIKGTQKIFDFDHLGGIEAEDSNFNTHRINIIRNSIIKNLSVAMANFNKYSAISTDFQMPKLKDTDWDKIMNNISIISFMQGANIGGKIYNGYSIITNTKNEDVVTPDSIYIKTSDNVIHRITEEGLNASNSVGVFNVNLEKRTGQSNDSSTIYYFPVYGTLSYDSMVTQNKVSANFNGNTLEYVNNYLPENLKTIYYTALARERYGIYRQKLEI